MKLRSTNLLAAAACLGAGYILGKTGNPAPPISLEASAQAQPTEVATNAAATAPHEPASLEFLAMTPIASLAEAERGTQSERLVKMGRFIQTATAAELAAFVTKAGKGTNQTALGIACMRWLELDPAAALAADKDGQAWWCYGKVNADVAMAAAEKHSKFAIQAVLVSIAQSDPEKALALSKKYPDGISSSTVLALVDGFSRMDPAAGARYALDNKGSLNRPLEIWLRQDPRAALAWGEKLEDPKQRQFFMEQVTAKLVTTDPGLALELAIDLKPGKNKIQRLAESMAALGHVDLVAAKAALEKLPDGLERDFAAAAIAGTQAADASQTNYALASVDWSRLDEHFREPVPLTDPLYVAWKKSFSDLMLVAPEQTTAHIFSLPASNLVSMSMAMRQWASVEPEKASAWLNAQPSGPKKDNGIMGLNRWLTLESAEPDFEAALVWTKAATEKTKSELYRNLFSRWYISSQEQALRALSTLPVSEEQRANLQKFISN